jgi:hypothetical protein
MGAMSRGLVVVAVSATLSCSAIVDSSGLTDEFGRPDATLDTGSAEVEDTAVLDTRVLDDVVEVAPPDSGHDCESRIRNGTRYLLCKDTKTYEEAEIVCAADFGAKLVIIRDEPKQAFLHAWLFARNNAWIGLDDRKKELDYRWIDGSAPTYLNWRTGPSDADYNDCVWMETGGTWDDRMCNNTSIRAWYFCEGG